MSRVGRYSESKKKEEKIELHCPRCNAWLGDLVLRKNNVVVKATISSDFVEVGKLCRVCQEDQGV